MVDAASSSDFVERLANTLAKIDQGRFEENPERFRHGRRLESRRHPSVPISLVPELSGSPKYTRATNGLLRGRKHVSCRLTDQSSDPSHGPNRLSPIQGEPTASMDTNKVGP